MQSTSEVAPLTALESLATGTPVVITKNNYLDIRPDDLFLVSVESNNLNEIRNGFRKFINTSKDKTKCAQLVANHTWDNVASELSSIYARLLS